MSNERIIWKFPDTYRKGYANVGDYTLIIEGEGAYRFGWKFQYKNEIMVTSGKDHCRSVPEARRIVEALFKLHSQMSQQ